MTNITMGEHLHQIQKELEFQNLNQSQQNAKYVLKESVKLNQSHRQHSN